LSHRIVLSMRRMIWMCKETAMAHVAKDCRSTIIPAMRYRDCVAAIEWLCKAFGFEKNAVYMGEGNTVAHAQLTFGNGMIMLGSVQSGEYGRLMAQPDEIGMRETQSACLIVSDADAIYAMAKAAGAEMVMDLKEMEYGGKAFTCRDPEGHVWSIGTYDPWETHGE
jgi:uncharacterized glyoxalase superfamily protein PhnB